MSQVPQFDLTIRKIPFDLKVVLSDCTSKQLIEKAATLPGGMPYALSTLAYSVWVEYAEHEVAFLQKNVGAIFGGNEVSDFIKQEMMHAGYHSKVNKVIEPRYVNQSVGPSKVNHLVYPVFAAREELYSGLLGSDQKERNRCLKRMWLKVAAFELCVGVFGAIANMQMIEENFDQILKTCSCLEYLYLWMYHYAEEMEHAEIPSQFFEQYYGETIWSKENGPIINEELNQIFTGINAIALRIGLDNGFKVSYGELMSSKTKKLTFDLRDKFKGDSSNEEAKSLRRKYIDLFDRVWSPRLLEAIFRSDGQLKAA